MPKKTSVLREKKRILLIIEDNPLLTAMYKTAFEKEGFEVNTAHNGQEGLELAKREKPSMVLLDVLMPGMGGIEVLRELKKMGMVDGTKVIMLTVMTDEETKKEALSLGALDYLIKTELDLPDIVKKVLFYMS